jgi:transposase InsO family protein
MDSSTVLHNRLGHRLGLGHGDPGFCEPCALAKSKHKLVRGKAKPHPGVRAGQRVHIDLTGPMSTPAAGSGALYACGILDEATRYSAVFLLKNKSGALSALQAFVRTLKTAGYAFEHGCSVHSDQDTVFKAADFTFYCSDHGVRQVFSPPHSHAKTA